MASFGRQRLTGIAVLLSVLMVITMLHMISVHPPLPPTSDPSAEINSMSLSARTLSPPSIPLVQLAAPTQTTNCGANEFFLENNALDENLLWEGGRKIPRIVHLHLINASRCVGLKEKEFVDAWRLANHSLFLHDDSAVDRLMWRRWPEFPQLRNVQRCVMDAVRYKSELWRLLVLWEYGGIYTEWDRVPKTFNATTIQNEDEAFFTFDVGGKLRASFIAAAPRHPLIYYSIVQVSQNVLNMQSLIKPTDTGFSAAFAFQNAYNFYNSHTKRRPNSPTTVRGKDTNSTIRLGDMEKELEQWKLFSRVSLNHPSSAAKNISFVNGTEHDVSPKHKLDYERREVMRPPGVYCLEMMYMFDRIGGASVNTTDLFHNLTNNNQQVS